jgi:hypothetical protein
MRQLPMSDLKREILLYEDREPLPNVPMSVFYKNRSRKVTMRIVEMDIIRSEYRPDPRWKKNGPA